MARSLSVSRLERRVGLLLALLSSLMQSAVLVPLIAAWHRDRALSLADALTRARAAFPQLCLTYAAPALAMIAAAWLYSQSDAAAMVSGLALLPIYPRWLFSTQAVLLENATPLQALRRSAALLNAAS